MKKFVMNIFLAAGVVTLLLFSGCASGIINTSQSTTTDISQQKNAVTNNDAVITCYVGGIPHSQMISYASGTYLKELFSALASANARDPCSAETQHLQQQILLYAEQQGLLPAGTSADTIFEQLGKRNQNFASQNIGGVLPVTNAGTGREMFCNFVSTGEGSAFPIIILPRFIPLIMSPIPRLFVGWKTPLGITSCGGLRSGTGFIASGEQQGLALGFWGIGFSIFLPPVMAYGMFGYALFAKVSAEEMEYWPPNSPPEIMQTDPADDQQMVPVTITELRFEINDLDNDLMSYNVTTEPNIGSGSGGLKPDGIYSIPVSGLESLTNYSWYIQLTDGKDTVNKVCSFTTEPTAPKISSPSPEDAERDVPMNLPQLQFTLKDYQGDAMEYTVQTSPNIGSQHEAGVHDGTYTVPISGMAYGASYRWYVNVTDGTHWARKIYSFTTGYPSPFDPFDYGWQYRKQITIDHTQVTDDLDNFPVLISTTDADLMKAQDDGDDILFMNGAGVAVKQHHEIETFDVSSGKLVAWVNIIDLSSNEDTIFYVYYGNPDCINQEYPEKTWDSHYKGVWHMNDATTSTIADSTSNGITGMKKAANMPIELSGMIGKGQQFDRTETVWEYITMGDLNKLRFSGDFTISAWIYPLTTQNMRVAGKQQDISGNYKGYSLNWDLQGPGSKMSLRVDGGGYNYQYIYANEEKASSNWYYLSGMKQSGTNYFYIDGVQQSQTGTQTLVNSDYSFCIGAWKTDSASANFYGTIDEVRVSDIGRSSAWIETEYNNMNNPTLFFIIGPEEPHP
jgi:hypothetical protein